MKTRNENMTIAALLLVVAMGVTSCKMRERVLKIDAGPKVTDVRQLVGFEEIDITGSPTVYYTQSDSFSISVTGHESAVADILTEIKGKSLHVRNRSNISSVNASFDDSDNLKIYVTSPDLTAIRLNGSGDFVSTRRIDTDDMTITLRGSGDIDIKSLICDRCRVELVGSGDIDIDRVEAPQVDASLVGSGDIDLGLYKVQHTSLSVKGSGDIEGNFDEGCEWVECDLRGSGDILLKGKVGHLSSHKSGSGDINTEKLSIR